MTEKQFAVFFYGEFSTIRLVEKEQKEQVEIRYLPIPARVHEEIMLRSQKAGLSTDEYLERLLAVYIREDIGRQGL